VPLSCSGIVTPRLQYFGAGAASRDCQLHSDPV
jgi:hypothetical protein